MYGDLACGGSDFWNQWSTRRRKGPSGCSAGEGEFDGVGTRIGIGMEAVGSEGGWKGAISSVDGVGIGEVFVDGYVLVRACSNYGQVDSGRVNGEVFEAAEREGIGTSGIFLWAESYRVDEGHVGIGIIRRSGPIESFVTLGSQCSGRASTISGQW